MIVGPEEMQRADTPSPIYTGLLQGSDEFAEAGAVVHGGERIITALVDFL
jgi:hypothetical protein